MPSPSADPPPPAAPQVPGGLRMDRQVLVAVIGQTAAIFAAAAAIVYAAGAISLAFRLWYDNVPILPVLVQLPRSWSFAQAITGLLPLAAVSGLVAVFAWKRIREVGAVRAILEPDGSGLRTPSKKREARLWVVSVVLAAIFAGIAWIFSRYLWISPLIVNGSQQRRGAIFPRPLWSIFVICLILDTVSIRVALHFLPKLPVVAKRIYRDLLQAGVVALAFVPVVASILAVNAFPIVKICGSEFANRGTQGHRFAIGTLIGVSGQYMYVAEILTKKQKFAAGYIAVIPLSEARLVAVGRNASCGQLAPPVPGRATAGTGH